VSLERVIAAIEDRITGVKFVGPDRKADTDKPPRIGWEPRGDSYLPPQGLGGQGAESAPLATRQWTVLMEIWGETFAQTESITNELLAAVQDVVGRPNYGIAPGQWNTGGPTAKGCTYHLNLLLKLPVPRSVDPVRPVTSDPTFKLNETPI
jgi:hypothetical protein